MALRVLLADNSETIKKVIQLTLQDYAVDLRIVASGTDVIDVIEKFKPEIIFVDILLQKKSGYDVSREIKQHPTYGSTPVILMWSGFMEFDEQKAKESLADARLEKPFDAKTLRELVQKFVSKTKTNTLESFLDFPDLPSMQETPKKTANKNLDPLADLEKIKQESLKFAPQKKEQGPIEELPVLDVELEVPNEEDFEMKPLSQSTDAPSSEAFKLELPDDLSGDEYSVDSSNVDKIEDMSFLLNPEAAPIAKPEHTAVTQKTNIDIKNHPIVEAAKTSAVRAVKENLPETSLNQNEIESIVNSKVQEVIEKVVWQVVPELASEIIRKELSRLLKDNNHES